LFMMATGFVCNVVGGYPVGSLTSQPLHEHPHGTVISTATGDFHPGAPGESTRKPGDYHGLAQPP
jgi:hypothetical protein